MIRRSDLVILALLVAGCAKEDQAPPERAAPPPPASPSTAPLQPQILSPHRGDILLEGHSFVIHWQAPDWQRVNLAVAMGGKDRGHLAMDRDAALDTLTWQIPLGYVTGFGITRSENMRLRLENAADPNQFVDSEPFTVSGVEP